VSVGEGKKKKRYHPLRGRGSVTQKFLRQKNEGCKRVTVGLQGVAGGVLMDGRGRHNWRAVQGRGRKRGVQEVPRKAWKNGGGVVKGKPTPLPRKKQCDRGGEAINLVTRRIREPAKEARQVTKMKNQDWGGRIRATDPNGG